MRKRVYDTDPVIRLLLAKWPTDVLTYKQLYAYGQRIGVKISSKDIYNSIGGFKHLGLVETKSIAGTVQIKISKELRNYNPTETYGIKLPTLETIKDISPFKSVVERKLNPPDPPKISYSFAIRSVIATFKPDTQFSYTDVQKILEKRGIHPGGKTNQVQPYLSSLYLKKGILVRVRRGQPTIYQVTQDFYDYFRPERNTMIAAFPEWKSHFEINFQVPEPEPEPEPSVREVAAAARAEENVLPDEISAADFGAAMFEYMLELRSGNGVKEVQRLRTKLEDTQLNAHNLHLEITRLKATIKKLDDIKHRQENTIKDLTTELNAAKSEVAIQGNKKKSFTMRDVVSIKGRPDNEPSNTVRFNFGT